MSELADSVRGTPEYQQRVDLIESFIFIAGKMDAQKVAQMPELEKQFYQDHLIIIWDESKDAVAAATEMEMMLRKAVVDFAFDPKKEKGTERIELGNGWELKSVKKLNYGFVKNLDGKTDKDKIEAALEEIGDMGAEGSKIADNLIHWNPALSQSTYKELPKNMKAVIDKVIVTTAGAPTLEIIEPKD